MPSKSFSLVLGVFAALLTACGGSTPRPPLAPFASTTGPKTAATATRAPQPFPVGVAISNQIRTSCGIPDADAYFTFDSALLTAAAHTPLNDVATCFKVGALKGRPLRLIGHADPRGETEYNMTLGLYRADAVGQYLVTRGVASTKTKTTSRGAMDATGTDESSWQKDRRVDVTLGD